MEHWDRAVGQENLEPMRLLQRDRARVVGLGAAVRGGGQRRAALLLPLRAARSRAVISVCHRAAVCARLSIAVAASRASRILDAQHGLWSAEGCPGAFADNLANERARSCATQLWRQISLPSTYLSTATRLHRTRAQSLSSWPACTPPARSRVACRDRRGT